MSSLERLELLFAPIYWFIMAVGYAHFFMCMIPGMAAAFLLGGLSGELLISRFILRDSPRTGPGLRGFFRAHGWRWTLLALLWDAGALALSVFLGRWNGWLILYAQKGQRLGGWTAAVCFLLGRVFLPRFKKR